MYACVSICDCVYVRVCNIWRSCQLGPSNEISDQLSGIINKNWINFIIYITLHIDGSSRHCIDIRAYFTHAFEYARRAYLNLLLGNYRSERGYLENCVRRTTEMDCEVDARLTGIARTSHSAVFTGIHISLAFVVSSTQVPPN